MVCLAGLKLGRRPKLIKVPKCSRKKLEPLRMHEYIYWSRSMVSAVSFGSKRFEVRPGFCGSLHLVRTVCAVRLERSVQFMQFLVVDDKRGW